ncbi:MAG: hypothetical protein ACKOAY_11000 [Haliscomenobacter sp.]
MQLLRKFFALLLLSSLSWSAQAVSIGWGKEEIIFICPIFGMDANMDMTTSMGVAANCQKTPWSFCWSYPCKIITYLS